MNKYTSVDVCDEPLMILTYGLGQPEKYPMFFEKRVYQGSSGKVYPVPFIDKVYDQSKVLPYRSIRMENSYVKLVLLPEIGGRIFLGQDKTNNDYDFFYRQDVIKPALVGLAGPWISGGVEFNWPQHHRPGTYLPADVAIEKEGDGIYTVWQSEHDPLNRLKGMHGIRLKPNSSLIELRGRLYNRTAHTQTFLWWANVAAKVHEQFQSFFPPDVNYVADHAVRAMSTFPHAENDYYGVDYARRQGANDLSWYRNIPVPTSYMVCQTEYGFFGGYDYKAQGGFIHVANRHISPGKKQWTWGNHEFGWAWDRELTDDNGPYVELMAGVYTDNQPDFSYLAPYETKTFSQFWWPYRKLGPVQEANTLAAIRLVVEADRRIDLGLAVSRPMDELRVIVRHGEKVLKDTTVSASPEEPWQCHDLEFVGEDESALCVWVLNSKGEAVIGYRPVSLSKLTQDRPLATEPPMPESIESLEELYLTGEHLGLYRHPTRYPELYWEEALARDPMDVRCNLALGKLKLSRGLLEESAIHFDRAIARFTFRHPNPESGEAHFYLGLTRRYEGSFDHAYGLFYKATWNFAWRAAAYYELACIDMRRGKIDTAIEHLDKSLLTNADNNKCLVAKAICLRQTGQKDAALEALAILLQRDKLDHWSLAERVKLLDGRAQLSKASRNDAQTVLDVAFDYADCGCFTEAADVLEAHHCSQVDEVQVPNPMQKLQLTHYVLAWIYAKRGNATESRKLLETVEAMSPDYAFPSRLHEMIVLEWVLEERGFDRNAGYGLGNFYYDKKRYGDAVNAWDRARQADDSFAIVHRNLGLAYWNVKRDGEAARASYLRAMECDVESARLVIEYVQLCLRLGDAAEVRLEFLESKLRLVNERDDACVELATLYNVTGAPQKALDLLLSRTFHPWEGGEGKVLRQYTTSRLLLGQDELKRSNAASALQQFDAALEIPESLGEKYHLLQGKADVRYWQGKALQALGKEAEAQIRFEEAASESGDFQKMAVTSYSELTIYKAMALHELGKADEAQHILGAMIGFAETEKTIPAKIDYFATSLPNMLVFEEDICESKIDEMQGLIDLARDTLQNLCP